MHGCSWRWRRRSSNLILGLLVLSSVSGCAAVPSPSAYKPKMPVLTIEQFESCVIVEPESQREIQTTCVRLLAQEYGEIVTEFKAQCLALGHGAEYCGTAGARMEPTLMLPVSAGGCFQHELKLEEAP